MTYICTLCNEKVEINKSDFVTCPYCTSLLIEESKYEQVKDMIGNENYTEKDLEDILKKEEELWKKIAGSSLEKIKEYIDAMYKLLKDPKAEWKHKVISIGALAYIISPLDIIPDFIPIIGYVDDVAAVMIAVASLGTAIEKYRRQEVINKDETNNKKDKQNKKIKKDKNNKTVIYKLVDGDYENKTIGIEKKNLMIWSIPANKRSNIHANLITNKIMNGNEMYVLNRNIENCLVPVNGFDQYIAESIFNEATMILKSLGVKKIKCTKKITTASSKKIVAKQELKNIFNIGNNINLNDGRVESAEIESEFENLDLSSSIKNIEFIDKLVWYFTDNSIISDTIFNERFEQGLIRTNIKKELELNSVLDIESRGSIKKYCSINSDINISESVKVHWNIDVEYYSLSNIERENLKVIYENIKMKIDERKNSFS